MGTLQMLYSPSDPTLSWVNFRSGATPPFADGYVDNSAGISRAVPGVNWGGTALIQLVAWEGPYTTWADAFNAAQVGQVRIAASNPLTLVLPTNIIDVNLTYLWGLQPCTFNAPEPGACALAGLAIAALLAFRRR